MMVSSWKIMACCCLLAGCSQAIPTQAEFASGSQAKVYGWISGKEYYSPVQTKLEVSVCQVQQSVCLAAASQEYKGVQLPVQYSFLLAPLQAGEGDMQIEATLYISGKPVAHQTKKYRFKSETRRIDLELMLLSED